MSSIPHVSRSPEYPASAEMKNRQEQFEAVQAFETLFLTQMVDEMMKTVDMSATMGAHASEMWRSVLSEALAENLMDSGGLGISDNIHKKLNAYRSNLGEDDGRS